MSATGAWAFNADLQAQSFGNTNWTSGHIFGWAELDPIPTRVTLAGGPTSNRTVTLNFPHDGIQNLYSFTPSANVLITSGPTLNAPKSGNWSYSFNVTLIDNQPGVVEFRMRLAAGSHRYTGSSLQVDGSPNLSKLFVFKSAALPGGPDLAIVKSGPANANPGSIIAYSIVYSNRINASTATGVQIVDTLPDAVSFVDASNGGQPLGNQIIWDLGEVARGSRGAVTYRVAVTNALTSGFTFQNNAVIAEAEDDANYADNSSSVITVVTGNCIPPSIVAGPVDAAICAGNSATFNVFANGSAPLSYQWQKDGANIAGANGDTLIATAAGNYSVAVSNLCGSAVSSPATLTVGGLMLTAQPVGMTTCEGQPASFNVVAIGDGLTYQWRKDGNDLAAATNALFAIAGVSAADAGNYDVVIAGTCGVTNSDVALLSVGTASITTQPASVAVCEGQPASFSVSATGDSLSYQWHKDGNAIADATNTLFEIASVSAADAGNYTVTVTATCGVMTSSAATLTVGASISIIGQPIGATICQGDSATLTASATGNGTIGYQWRKDGVEIPGAISSSYAATDAGAYDVIASGDCGAGATSSVATVSLNAPTVITAGPVGASICDGSSVTLAVSASGTSLGYQWRKDSVEIAGATSDSFGATEAGTYDVVVSGGCGPSTTSAPVAVSINAPATISTGPVGGAVCPGASVELSVSASGTSLAYQWHKDGVDIPGAIGSAYSFTAEAGNYDVVVTGICGSPAVSPAAVVAVNPLPVAVDDSYVTSEGVALSVGGAGVLGNDANASSAVLASGPAHGTLSLALDGSFMYTPVAEFSGQDGFAYTAQGECGASAPATVTIAVAASAVSNAPPVAVNDSYEVAEDDTLTVVAPGVLVNDSDPESATLSAVLVAGPAHGDLSFNSDGSFTYVPADNYNGADSFTYRANDGALDSSVATVSINVTPVDGAGDVDLYIKTARARVNWAKPNLDTLVVRGQINPRGIKDDLTGATLALNVNGVDVVPAQVLDIHGKSVVKTVLLKANCRIKNTNGAYMIRLSGANLRAALGLANANGAGLAVPKVRLTINGANLDVPVTVAQIEGPYRTKAGKASQLTFNFRKNRTLTGAFNCNNTAGTKTTKGDVVKIKGVVTAEGGGLIIPTGDIVVHIGNTVLNIPRTGLMARGDNWQYATKGNVTGVTRFVLANAARSFNLTVKSGSIGLPAATLSSPMKYNLPLMIEVPTATGPMTFESIIELKRSSQTASRWKR